MEINSAMLMMIINTRSEWKRKYFRFIKDKLNGLEYSGMELRLALKLISRREYPTEGRYNWPYQCWLKCFKEIREYIEFAENEKNRKDAGISLYEEIKKNIFELPFGEIIEN